MFEGVEEEFVGIVVNVFEGLFVVVVVLVFFYFQCQVVIVEVVIYSVKQKVVFGVCREFLFY